MRIAKLLSIWEYAIAQSHNYLCIIHGFAIINILFLHTICLTFVYSSPKIYIYIYIFVTIHILIFKIEIHSFLDIRYEKNIYIRYIKCDIIFRISLIDVPIGHLTRIYKWDI